MQWYEFNDARHPIYKIDPFLLGIFTSVVICTFIIVIYNYIPIRVSYMQLQQHVSDELNNPNCWKKRKIDEGYIYYNNKHAVFVPNFK